eukprot:1261809-Ditylum_brightwellii.AAC.1
MVSVTLRITYFFRGAVDPGLAIAILALVRKELMQLGLVTVKSYLLALMGSFLVFMACASFATGDGDITLICAVITRPMVLAILMSTAISMMSWRNSSPFMRGSYELCFAFL